MLKKILSLLCIVTICSAFAGIMPAVNAANEVNVIVNGVALETDQPAEIIDNRTMVPLRAIFEALGATVEWFPEDQGIVSQKGNIGILMIIGNNLLGKVDTANSSSEDMEYIELDVAPMIKNSRTLVPARAVAEAFGCDVQWDGKNRTVNISSYTSDLSDELKFGPKEINADFINGIIYYCNHDSDYIYAYNGTETKRYSGGGDVMGLIVYNNYIYYINDTNEFIYRINISTEKREIVSDAYKKVYGMYIYKNNLIVVGENSDEICVVESINLENNKVQRIYTVDTDKKYELYTDAENGFMKVACVEKHNNKTKIFDIMFLAIRADDFTVKEETLQFTTIFDMDNPAKDYFQVKKEYIYYQQLDYQTNASAVCYKINLNDNKIQEIDWEEFHAAKCIDMQSEWRYYYQRLKILRENEKKQTETVCNVGANTKILYEKNDIIIFNDTNMYHKNEVYIINGDGSNKVKISENNNSSNTTGGNSNNLSGFSNNSSSGGAQIAPPKKCGLCGGTGQMKCNMCGGDGMMPSLAIVGVGGGNFEESCRYCSGGRKQCLACGGDGFIE